MDGSPDFLSNCKDDLSPGIEIAGILCRLIFLVMPT
jgi:hypothetical protein